MPVSLQALLEVVPGAGLEPARCCQRGILNPLCLPISPPGHCDILPEVFILWRRVPEPNRDPRICHPLHSHSAHPPSRLGRETRFELATPTLARLCSTSCAIPASSACACSCRFL